MNAQVVRLESEYDQFKRNLKERGGHILDEIAVPDPAKTMVYYKDTLLDEEEKGEYANTTIRTKSLCTTKDRPKLK